MDDIIYSACLNILAFSILDCFGKLGFPTITAVVLAVSLLSAWRVKSCSCGLSEAGEH